MAQTNTLTQQANAGRSSDVPRGRERRPPAKAAQVRGTDSPKEKGISLQAMFMPSPSPSAAQLQASATPATAVTGGLAAARFLHVGGAPITFDQPRRPRSDSKLPFDRPP
jgi:hypothetical protein